MIDRMFGQLLNMTVTASIVIVAVLLVRLLLKRVPKIFSYALWAVVLFRLLCPVGIESPISPLPQIEPLIQVDAASNDLQTTITLPSEHLPMIEMEDAREDRFYAEIESNALPSVTVNSPITTDSTSVYHRITWLRIVEILWGSGVAVMLIYGVLSYVGLRRRLIGSVRTDDHLYIADSMDSPFVLGIIRPKIYLPSTLSEHEREYILLHERHHIRRGDHVIRLIAFLALCLHWFNPLVWIAFILSGKDMEMSCDEAVLRNLGWKIRADYSSSLLRLATGRQIVAGMPLAFGEGNTEGRIKNIALMRFFIEPPKYMVGRWMILRVFVSRQITLCGSAIRMGNGYLSDRWSSMH